LGTGGRMNILKHNCENKPSDVDIECDNNANWWLSGTIYDSYWLEKIIYCPYCGKNLNNKINKTFYVIEMNDGEITVGENDREDSMPWSIIGTDEIYSDSKIKKIIHKIEV
jgi:hypothetical protein